jgi:hypothetical protein
MPAFPLTNVADVHIHRETKQRPIDRYAEEQTQLIPLPASLLTAETRSN